MQMNVKLNYGILLHQQPLCGFMMGINYGLDSQSYHRVSGRRQQTAMALPMPVGRGKYSWVFDLDQIARTNRGQLKCTFLFYRPFYCHFVARASFGQR